MAAEFLSSLSFAARMAMPFLEPLAMEGVGANEILRRYMALEPVCSIRYGGRSRNSYRPTQNNSDACAGRKA